MAAEPPSWQEGMSSDNVKGLVLALSSSFFIGGSFIVKKKGLKKAGASGIRAGMLLRWFWDVQCNVGLEFIILSSGLKFLTPIRFGIVFNRIW